MDARKLLFTLVVTFLLTACGDYSGGIGSNSDEGGKPEAPKDDSSPRTTTEFFTQKVQPSLGVCRTCHVPGAIAALSDAGRDFLLSLDAGQDLANFNASWSALGSGVDSRILQMASGDEAHSGGLFGPKMVLTIKTLLCISAAWPNQPAVPAC